jgi:2-octaprenylphenol hydroxylase
MRISDAATQQILKLDANTAGLDALGSIVLHDALKDCLISACLTAGVNLYHNTPVNAIEQHTHGLLIHTTQQQWSADLVLFADGAHSVSRAALGIELITWPYHHHAIITQVNTEKPHGQTAYQRFYPEGPLAFLPLPDAHQSAIVWSTQSDQAEQLMQLDEQAFNAVLSERFAQPFGKITTITPRQKFPLHMRQARQYAGKNWLLLGDAAHTIHPLAGLGLNLGFADLACWLRLMGTSPQPHYANRLKRYQRERQSASWQIILLLESLTHVFSSINPCVNALRRVGFNTINTTRFLKCLLIDYAANI